MNELRSAEEKMHREWLDTLVEEFLGKLGPEIADYLVPKVYLIKGNPRQIVPQQVELLRPDLLVIGSAGRTGVSGLLMGNTAEAILNKVDCSVATVKPSGFKLPIHLWRIESTIRYTGHDLVMAAGSPGCLRWL